MFKWFRERRIAKSVEAARIFVNENYKEPPKTSTGTSSGIRYSRRAEPKFSRDVKYSISFSEEPKPKAEEDEKPQRVDEADVQYSLRESDVQYSLRESDVKYSDRDVRYSLRDNYDSSSIDRAVRSLSSTDSPLRALRTLEDNTNMSFVDKMLDYINIKHLRDSDVYKAAQVDRRLFSKIVSDRSYKPAKDTCIALSLALQLSLSEANDILSRAGYVLSHSSKRDVVIEYFFRERIYDLNDVNEILYRLDQKLIGR